MPSNMPLPSDAEFREALDNSQGNKTKAAEALGLCRKTVRKWVIENDYEFAYHENQPAWRETKERDTWVIESRDSKIRTVEDCLAKANVDTDVWEVIRVTVGSWDVTMKLRQGKVDKPFRSQNQKISIVLKRRVPKPVEDAVERLLDRLREKSPRVKKIKRLKLRVSKPRHAIEFCLPDPHFGLRCFKPGADADWNPELCASMVMETLRELIKLSKPYGPIERIVLPLGNDFFHADSLLKPATTAGTVQPEADAYFPTVVGGETLALEIVGLLISEFGVPIELFMIPGNHDRVTSFMLGRILRAYYRNDRNVVVHADQSPYKFWEYGVNLLGLEHGHSIQPIRLAALMANECPDAWARTKYREWHLGDQHRKVSSKPGIAEEQGVSVEYLPGVVPPNEWHRLKSYNWQKRAAMAFVYDYCAGPIARLQVNIDPYLNNLMGRE